KDTPIELILNSENNNVKITVRDYGIGIPESFIPQLFNKFSKIGRVGFNGEKSTGLGLYISKKIVEQHGGKLTVSSKENEGTSFTISLPAT
ncbi:sensor histidine kinase, partial [Pseudoxanthomonas sp. SGD-10]